MRKIFQQVPTAMDIDSSGITSAARQMSTESMDQVLFIQGDGGDVDISADPQIEPHDRVGAILTLVGMDNAKKITFEDGDGLILNGTAVLGLNNILELIWCGDNYIELGRNF